MSLFLFPPSGWDSQAARPSVPQEEQGGHAVPDSHTHHLCRGGGWSAQWNMGRHPSKGQKLNTGIANNTHSDVLALKELVFHAGFVVTFQKKCNKSTIFTPHPHQVLHSLVSSVEKQSPTASGFPLILHCKNFQSLHLIIAQEQDWQDVLLSLQRLSQPGKLGFQARTKAERFPGCCRMVTRFLLLPGFAVWFSEKYEELYCFSFNSNTDEQERRHEWALLDVMADYNRMGLPNSLWKLSSVNQQYKAGAPRPEGLCYGHVSSAKLRIWWCRSQVSDTYPADLFVPQSATLPVIAGSSKFRSRGRFPTLSYYSKRNHVCRRLFSSLF